MSGCGADGNNVNSYTQKSYEYRFANKRLRFKRIAAVLNDSDRILGRTRLRGRYFEMFHIKQFSIYLIHKTFGTKARETRCSE